MSIKSLTYALLPIAAYGLIPSPPSEYTQTLFQDDFDASAGSGPGSQWIPDIGHSYPGGFYNWGTGEIQYYTGDQANVHHDGGGNLLIVPIRDSNNGWTSARIETQMDSFAAPQGGKLRVEGRIQMPDVNSQNGLGYWPTFWLMAAQYRQQKECWPGCGEIDIMENVNGMTQVRTTLHCGTSPGGDCNEKNGLFTYSDCDNGNCSGAFHTYGLVIDRTDPSNESMSWDVDGKVVKTLLHTDVSNETWTNAIDHGFYIILNVAIGGEYPDAASNMQTPVAQTEDGHPMIVDYVAVYTT